MAATWIAEAEGKWTPTVPSERILPRNSWDRGPWRGKGGRFHREDACRSRCASHVRAKDDVERRGACVRDEASHDAPFDGSAR